PSTLLTTRSPPTALSTLSLHDALPISFRVADPFGAELAHFHNGQAAFAGKAINEKRFADADPPRDEHAALDDVGLAILEEPGQRSEEHTSELQSRSDLVCRLLLEKKNK